MSGGDGKGHNSGARSTGGVNGRSGKGGPSNNGQSSRGPNGGVKGGPTGLGGRGNGNNRAPNVAVGGSMNTTIGGYNVHVIGVRAINSGNTAGQVGNNGVHRGGGNGNGRSNSQGDSGKRHETVNKAETAQLEAEKKAKVQAEWDAAHPVEVAERKVNEALQGINHTQQDKINAELTIGVKANTIKQAVDNLQLAENNQDEFVIENPPHEWGKGWSEQVNALDKEVEARKSKLSSAEAELNAARDVLAQVVQRLDKLLQEKVNAEAHLNVVRQKVGEEKKAKEESDTVKNAVKFTADFYKELTSKYGDNASKIAQELAEAAKGKQIRNVDEALKAFDKYKNVLNKKFSAKDREAIAKALESVDRGLMAKNLAKFSKAFFITNKVIDIVDIAKEINNSAETGNWRPLLVKLETLAAGAGASWLVAFSFSVLTATPLGILGFGLLIAIVGALINDEQVEKINKHVLNI